MHRSFAFGLVAVVSMFGLAAVACTSESSEDPAADNAESGDEQDITKAPRCGGFAGLACASGYECVDDPHDSCNPATGGRDCMGLCAKKTTSPTCAAVRCTSGTHCVMDKVKCKMAPCPARPVCVP